MTLQTRFPQNFKIKQQNSTGNSSNQKNAILPIFYELLKGLQKQNMNYEVIRELNINEAWHFYADYINSLQYERYLQNPPYDGDKVKPYDFDIITITKPDNG